MNFERKFFRAAAQFLRCRLELIPTARNAEGLMLGMWDQVGEMRLICQEARKGGGVLATQEPREGPRPPGGGAVTSSRP